jgi:hypothetical protein
MIDTDYVARALRLEARCLREILMDNPILRRLISGATGEGAPAADDARAVYARLLRMSADYVQCTVPALRAASAALSATADPEEMVWAGRLAAYADDEADEQGRGHESWAHADLADLGAAELAAAPAHPAAAEYGWYFVEQAARHPYAILGAKSVLEELSVRVASAILAGVRAAGAVTGGGDEGARFVHHHGDLDVEHGRRGARDLRELRHVHQRRQVIEGAYVTTGVYRQLANHYL